MAKRGVIFKEAPVIAPKRSWCDDSAKHDTSCNFGELIVGHVSDHMAHDVIKLKSSSYGFVEAMLAPSFGKCDVFSYWFYVNKRHIWPDWKKFRPNNDQLLTWEQMRSFVSPTMPYITLDGLREVDSTHVENPYIINAGDGRRLSPIDNKFAYAVFKVIVEELEQPNKVYRCSLELVTEDLRFMPNAEFTISDNSTYIVVWYKRNLQEIQSKLGNLWYTYDNILPSMNIFSVGNLFNYMDLSIHDVQKDRCKYFDYVLRHFLVDYDYLYDSYNYTDVYWSTDLLTNFMNNHFINAIDIIQLNGEQFPERISFDDHSVDGYNYSSETFSVLTDAEFVEHTMVPPHVALADYVDSISYLSKIFNVTLDTRINTLPIRAYEYIYDEYFRDQNWIPVNTYTDFTRSGLESYETAEQIRYFSIRKKCWSHDPYTSALPGPQRGDAIRFLSDSKIQVNSVSNHLVNDVQGLSIGYKGSDLEVSTVGSPTNKFVNTELVVDLSGATIEAFRIANARQKYEELFARTGGRYVEWQRGVMGANISDIEDERPIYIYGSRNPIQIAQVVQTSATNVETDQPLGDLAGRGVYQGKGDYIEFDCPDDGILMQIICVVPQQSYQSGIAPIFTRHNWLDYPIPMFSQLGEEHVKTQSLWFTGNRDQDEKSFGYQSRYWDWKYSRDRVSGQLQTDLDYWTFAREFENEPVNGRDFLEVNVDYRQFAVQDRGVHHIYLSLYCDIQKNQALPVFGIPTL